MQQVVSRVVNSYEELSKGGHFKIDYNFNLDIMV